MFANIIESVSDVVSSDPTKLSDRELAARIGAGEAELAKLKSTADTKRVDAQQSAADFRKDPTEQRLSKREIEKQRADNADAAVVEHEATLAPLIAERERRTGMAKVEQLRREVDVAGDVQAIQARLADAYEQFFAVLETEMGNLAATLLRANDAVGPLTELEASLGLPSERRSGPRWDSHFIQTRELLGQRFKTSPTGTPREVELTWGSHTVRTAFYARCAVHGRIPGV